MQLQTEEDRIRALNPPHHTRLTSTLTLRIIYVEIALFAIMQLSHVYRTLQLGSSTEDNVDLDGTTSSLFFSLTLASFVRSYTSGIHRALVITMAAYSAKYFQTEPGLMYVFANAVLAPSLIARGIACLFSLSFGLPLGLGLVLFFSYTGTKSLVVTSLLSLRTKILALGEQVGQRQASGELWGPTSLYPLGTSLFTLGLSNPAATSYVVCGLAVIIATSLMALHCVLMMAYPDPIASPVTGTVEALNFAAHGIGWLGWNLYHLPRVYHAVHFKWRKRFYSTLALALWATSSAPLLSWILSGFSSSSALLPLFWLARASSFAIVGISAAVLPNLRHPPHDPSHSDAEADELQSLITTSTATSTDLEATDPEATDPEATDPEDNGEDNGERMDVFDHVSNTWLGFRSSLAAATLFLFLATTMCISAWLGWGEGGGLGSMTRLAEHSGSYDLAFHFCLLVGGFGVRGVFYAHGHSLYGPIIGGAWVAALGCVAILLQTPGWPSFAFLGLTGLLMSISAKLLQSSVKRLPSNLRQGAIW